MSPDAEGACIMQHAFFLLVYESHSHVRLFGTIHNCHEKNTLFFSFFFIILTCFRTKLLQFNSLYMHERTPLGCNINFTFVILKLTGTKYLYAA